MDAGGRALKVQLVKVPNVLAADSAADEELLEQLKPGDVVTAEIKKARNPAFHRKGMGMLRELFNNQEQFDNFDQFRKWLQIKAGVVDTIIGPTGKVYYEVKSLSFADMDDVEFSEVFEALITAAYEAGFEWVLEQYA